MKKKVLVVISFFLLFGFTIVLGNQVTVAATPEPSVLEEKPFRVTVKTPKIPNLSLATAEKKVVVTKIPEYAVLFTVAPSDTVWKLKQIYNFLNSRLYKTQSSNWKQFLEKVKKLNPGKNVNVIFPGEEIRIPELDEIRNWKQKYLKVEILAEHWQKKWQVEKENKEATEKKLEAIKAVYKQLNRNYVVLTKNVQAKSEEVQSLKKNLSKAKMNLEMSKVENKQLLEVFHNVLAKAIEETKINGSLKQELEDIGKRLGALKKYIQELQSKNLKLQDKVENWQQKYQNLLLEIKRKESYICGLIAPVLLEKTATNVEIAIENLMGRYRELKISYSDIYVKYNDALKTVSKYVTMNPQEIAEGNVAQLIEKLEKKKIREKEKSKKWLLILVILVIAIVIAAAFSVPALLKKKRK